MFVSNPDLVGDRMKVGSAKASFRESDRAEPHKIACVSLHLCRRSNSYPGPRAIAGVQIRTKVLLVTNLY
jgi:hypothetical protein